MLCFRSCCLSTLPPKPRASTNSVAHVHNIASCLLGIKLCAVRVSPLHLRCCRPLHLYVHGRARRLLRLHLLHQPRRQRPAVGNRHQLRIGVQ